MSLMKMMEYKDILRIAFVTPLNSARMITIPDLLIQEVQLHLKLNKQEVVKCLKI